MPTSFSHQAIEHLVYLITGGDYGSPNDGPPPYRTGGEITRWMQRFVPTFELNSQGRLASVRECIDEMNLDPSRMPLLRRIISAAIDPRDFPYHEVMLGQEIEAFNAILEYDDYRLVGAARGLKLEPIVSSIPQVALFNATLIDLEWDSVEAELQRMLESCDSDPEDAITAACSLIEALCRTLLVELDIPIPNDRSVSSLYRTLIGELGLSPDRADFPEEVAEESRRILGSLKNTVDGLGALRTKAGDAHGREPARPRVDARMARLAAGSATTIAQFLVESWQRYVKQTNAEPS